MKDLPLITKVSAIDHYIIDLHFNTGEIGILDLKELAGKGVFSNWDDENSFFRVKITQSGRAIEWPFEIDMCADALLLRLQNQQITKSAVYAVY